MQNGKEKKKKYKKNPANELNALPSPSTSIDFTFAFSDQMLRFIEILGRFTCLLNDSSLPVEAS
jgi:hypothetical protein